MKAQSVSNSPRVLSHRALGMLLTDPARGLLKIALALLLLAALIWMGIGLSMKDDQLREQALALERRKTSCMSVRAGLEMTRRSLRDISEERRHWGRTMFDGYMRDDWHMVNMCASETVYVGEACAPSWASSPADDQACMLHALDWALVNIR